MKFAYKLLERRWHALDLLLTALWAGLTYNVIYEVANGGSPWELVFLALYTAIFVWIVFFQKKSLDPMTRDEAFDTLVKGVTSDPRDVNALKTSQALLVAGFNGEKAIEVLDTIWNAQDNAWQNDFKNSIGSAN